MFTLSSPDLPAISAYIVSSGATIAIIETDTPNNFASITSIASSTNAIAFSVSQLATFTGSTININVSSLNLQSVEAIEIAGVRYWQSLDPDNIIPGQFFWNIYTQRITVIASSDNFLVSFANILLYAVNSIPTDYVAPPYPAIFGFVPMEATFSWGCGFESSPTGKFEFTTYASLKHVCIAALTPGSEFFAYFVGFRIDAISITELPATVNPQRLIKVSVSLGGKQENYLDRIVSLLRRNLVSKDEQCLGKITSLDAFVASEYPTFTTVQVLAARSGTSFSGAAMRVDIPADTPRNEGTTFISKATERVRQKGDFIRYSDYSAVKTISLHSVPIHSFTETQIKSPVSASISGKKVQLLSLNNNFFHSSILESTLPSVVLTPEVITIVGEDQSIYPYVHTYEPRYSLSGRFETDKEKYQQERSQGGAADNTVPEWKQRERVVQEIPDGDLHPEIPPANTGALKDLSNNFSASGITKTYKLSKTIDGLPQSEYLQRWGFAFLASQMYSRDLTSIPGATNVWQMVEEKTTTYLYDEQTGYQLGSDTVGWELIRFEEESKNETVALNTGKEADLQRRKLYEYFKLPYRKSDRVYLEALRSYYNDLGAPPVEVYPVCLPNGGTEYRAKFDPTYVEPFFASITTTHENSFKAIANPESKTDKPLPPKTTGKESFFRKNISILPSAATKTIASGYLSSTEQENNDSYNEYSSQFSSQDSGFSNSAENTTFTRQFGRPSVATKLPSTFERVEPEDKAGEVVERTRYNYYAETAFNPFYRSEGISSSRASQTALSGGSLNYSAARTRAEAQRAAVTEITINNIKDCLQETLTIPFSPHIKEGDKFNYTCNGTYRQRRVLNISHEVKFNGLLGGVPIVTSDGSKVTLGLERETVVHFTREKEQLDPTIKNPDPNLLIFFVPDTYPLGEIIDPDMETRRNFS